MSFFFAAVWLSLSQFVSATNNFCITTSNSNCSTVDFVRPIFTVAFIAFLFFILSFFFTFETMPILICIVFLPTCSFCSKLAIIFLFCEFTVVRISHVSLVCIYFSFLFISFLLLLFLSFHFLWHSNVYHSSTQSCLESRKVPRIDFTVVVASMRQ